jgi:hypothetical protein
MSSSVIEEISGRRREKDDGIDGIDGIDDLVDREK